MNDETDKKKDVLRVLDVQGKMLDRELEKANTVAENADGAIGDAEALSGKLGKPLPERSRYEPPLPIEPPQLRPWEEIVHGARLEQPGELTFADIEMEAATSHLSSWNSEFAALHKLTRYDLAVALAAGIFAGLADIFLVQVPKHPAFLGGPAAEGGWLSNIIKERFNKLLPEDTVHWLEREYRVPYDASTSSGLAVPIRGLGPRTHRMQSLGHDPFLGWLFGVRDVLMGKFTAIGSDGQIVIQSIPGWEPAEFGVGLFIKIVEAFKLVAGHLLSDVVTPAGLPPPLFGLAQFFQQETIGDHSIADIARAMYRSGYDFRHFLAGGVTVAIIEVFVRTAWTVRELSEGKKLMDALPIVGPRLRSGLFLSHSVAAAVNAGKVAVTQNPLSLNWAQWLAFFRYLLPQMHWLLVGRERARDIFVQKKLDDCWKQLDDELAVTWSKVFGSAAASSALLLRTPAQWSAPGTASPSPGEIHSAASAGTASSTTP
jgi:hypothetical protein